MDQLLYDAWHVINDDPEIVLLADMPPAQVEWLAANRLSKLSNCRGVCVQKSAIAILCQFDWIWP